MSGINTDAIVRLDSYVVTRPISTVRQRGRTVRETVAKRALRVFLTGFFIIIPLVLTLYLLDVALQLFKGIISPIVLLLKWSGLLRAIQFSSFGRTLVELGIYRDVLGWIGEIVAAILLLGGITLIGSFARIRSGERVLRFFDEVIISIPGVGSIYKSFRRTGDVMLNSGLENFREVKIVEFPHTGLYSIAFVTNTSPVIRTGETLGDDLLTVFVPLAPNPVMGGFLLYVSEEDVIDVDMTVEEAARSLITSGIASPTTDTRDQSDDRLMWST